MKRKELREWALKLFYQMDINKDYEYKFFQYFIEENSLDTMEDTYLNDIYSLYTKNQEIIDERINNASKSWDIKRIAKIDLNILRISVTEILFMDSIPDKVSINEAVELGKEYGDGNSYKFINGLLANILEPENSNTI